MKKATIKTYNSNATVFCEGESIEIDLTHDANCDFTLEENLESARELITDKFGNDVDIDEVMQTLRIYLSPVSAD